MVYGFPEGGGALSTTTGIIDITFTAAWCFVP